MKSKLFKIVLCVTVLTFLFSTAFANKTDKVEVKAVDNNQSVSTTASQSKTDAPSTKSLAGETIDWYVISSGGGSGTSDNFKLSGTVGQFAIGGGESDNFKLLSGYWQDFGGGGCCISLRGNADGDPSDVTDVDDLVYMVNFAFKGGPGVECLEEGDVDASGAIDVDDLVFMVNFAFKGGPTPGPCFVSK